MRDLSVGISGDVKSLFVKELNNGLNPDIELAGCLA